LGFRTVVLARELTLKEVEYVCSHITARAEAFVHGAHCMSVSGMCYLSAMLGGRSGNRGLCAQPCRLDWLCGGEGYALSLKDMSLLPRVREMEEAGVGIFKIEGRMKRPEYVAAAVTACRKAMDGEPYDAEQLRAVFSRSGFTDGYLTGKRDKSMFGYRTKEDVTGAEKTFRELSALYEKETPLAAVDMAFSMDGQGSALTVSDAGRSVTVTGPVPEEARNRPTDAALAEKNLTKTGGTPFRVRSFTADIAPGLILSAAALNALRREALDRLLTLRGAAAPWKRVEGPFAPPLPARERTGEPALWARFYDPEQIPAEESCEKIILPVGVLTPALIGRYGERLIGELPAVLWPEDEEAFEKELAALRDAGLREVWGENIYAVPLARRLGLKLHGGSGLNVLNTPALELYEGQGLKSVTASFEMSMKDFKALGGSVPLGLMAYGSLPLMRFRNCPVRARIGCGKCGGAGGLTDRKGVRFPVECTGKKYSTLLNSVPLHVAERDLRGADHIVLYFTRET
ncbi:MAG: U32 family peptidase, partial [Oscillospiraceae bacterium]|nr:U32 family peptidase [Oscillospiraceae bacterium]